MNEKTKEKLDQLQALVKQKETLEKKIENLLSPEKKVTNLPPGFSINDEVSSIIKEAGATGTAAVNILSVLEKKFPSYGITSKKVASSLAYLKNVKKKVSKVGRGVYKFLENQQVN